MWRAGSAGETLPVGLAWLDKLAREVQSGLKCLTGVWLPQPSGEDDDKPAEDPHRVLLSCAGSRPRVLVLCQGQVPSCNVCRPAPDGIGPLPPLCFYG